METRVSQLRLRIQGIIIFSLIHFLLYVSPAHALRYQVAARDNTTVGNNCCGTYGTSYVMSSPAIANTHVSSLYAYQVSSLGPWNVAETGIYYAVGYSPRFFGVKVVRGLYCSPVYFGNATPGTNHSFTLSRSTINLYWRTYVVDGSAKISAQFSDIWSGISLVGSERQSLSDTNYSHFWALMKRNSSGNWYYWSNLQLYTDNDPGYTLQKISNIECKMIKG